MPGVARAYARQTIRLSEIIGVKIDMVELERLETELFGKLSVEGTSDYDSATQVNRCTWHVSASGKPDAWVLPLVMRSIFPQKLPLLLAAGGFQMATRFGDLSQTPFGPSSLLQVCVCRAAA
jgi:hypothetical protein